ncbi:hypothetical protein BLNAU_19635 [Blattamonas nauphoetae]|uniref:Uncharacterized protein n=1 Tax=Blattamonas nauphoetae TaxID=2049346 RepID=A0ABQ9X1G3_9EUKA|nr:hypothetical protein BLNAU_19635 [Blattamonas nauphoetae]
MDFPLSADGEMLTLLAQLNFAELPHLPHFLLKAFCSSFFQLILDAFVENCADAGQNFTSDDVDAMVDDYCVYIASKRCHTIGGYTNFVEADPRMYNSKFEPYTVNLLQIGSVGDIYVSECGIASFLIKPDKLDAKDFTDVLYIIDSS